MGPTVDSAIADQALPLSLAQREVWLDQRAWPSSAHLTIGGGVFVRGVLDLPRFQQAFLRLIAENEALRLAPMADGTQKLLADYQLRLAHITLPVVSDFVVEAERIWQAQTREAFPLDGTPPWRIVLLSNGENEHCLLLQFHHLVMDGWGTAQLMRSWAACYAAQSQNEPAPCADPTAYRRFIDETQTYRASADFERDANFWQSQLPMLPPPLLERHYAASTSDTLPAAQLAVLHLPRAEYNRMFAFANEHGQGEFALFLSALALYFSRVQQLDEVVIGIPCLNRSGRRNRETLGMYVGVMPLRVPVDRQASAEQLLTTVNRVLRQALRHAHYPLSETGRRLQAIRQNRDSLFDVLLSFERQDYSVQFGEAKTVGSRQFFTGIARYPLGVTVCEFAQDQDVELVLEGSALCFNAGEVDLLGRRLYHLIVQMIDAPTVPVHNLTHLPPEERWALLDGLHHEQAQHDAIRPFISLFEHHVALLPDACALLWDGGRMDYATLNQRANARAAQLRQLGAGKDVVIAVCMRRSAEAVISILAIAKAGAAFLPLDVDAPDARLAAVLEESRALLVLVDTEAQPRLQALHTQVLDTTLPPSDPAATMDWPAAASDDLAYVLFTSGSTGRPKGVMVEHAALSRRVAWLARNYAITSNDCAAQATQLTFDPALIELILPLVHGASVALPPPGRQTPEAVASFAIRHGVTIMAFVPSTLQRFLDAAARQQGLRLRVACCGGEVLSPALAERFITQTRARLFNVYGPTEACIFATAWECERRPSEVALPVGRPVDDTRIYVLDAEQQLLPFACAGEIYIGGRALARGYLHRPDLDKAVFLPDPFLPGERIYRTGDRGWLSSDGDLYFLGRTDRQVKLRGYRIELGEIEHALMTMPEVTQALCLLLNVNEKPYLHAWVAAPGIRADALQRHLRARLPDYMLPAHISVLPELPMTSSGKVDQQALRAMPSEQVHHRGRGPASRLERELLPLWQAALHRQDISVEDSFFELGGDSLSAIDILTGIDKLTGKHASLLLLTEHPSVADMALALLDEFSPASILLPLSGQSADNGIYLAASGHGDLLRLRNLAQALGTGSNLSMLQPPPAETFGSIKDLAEIYAARIAASGRTNITLAGFSVGGITALETARVLQERGLEVRAIVLIDTVYPRSLLRKPRFWRLLGWLTRNLYVQELSMNGRRLGAMFGDAGLVSQIMALGGYHPTAFAGRILLVKSSGLANWEHALFRPWYSLLQGKFSTCEVPGLHGSMFDIANVQALATALLSVQAAEGVENGGNA
ncbi:non-ribosomal peptide synthetase [Chitinimonas sp. PSY-7]|uniref:amino acid adenylation domain-containing protein n=1 Tax=Chitinimonas sp. PSY-7 TaxID=3459088 RepID=UPI00404024EB